MKFSFKFLHPRIGLEREEGHFFLAFYAHTSFSLVKSIDHNHKPYMVITAELFGFGFSVFVLKGLGGGVING